MRSKTFSAFAIASIVIIISLFAAFPSFQLALFGDDWQQIWKYFQYLRPGDSPLKYFTFFIGGYGSFEILTGFLYSLYGQDYKMYYIFAYIYRLIAAFSIWPLILYLTRSKLATFYGVLFLSVTLIGLESVNWVVNSPAYLAIASLSLFLYFFIKSREDLKVKSLVIAVIFFYLAHVFASIRMTGLLPFTLFLELFLNFKSPNLKLTLKRLLVILISFTFISVTSSAAEGSGTLLGNASEIIGSGFSTFSILLKQGRSDFLFYPIMILGRIVIPYTFKIPVIILFFTLIIFISVLISNIPRGKKIIASIIGSITAWTLVSLLVYNINKSTLSSEDAISLLIGGIFLCLGIILLIFTRKEFITRAFFIGIFWTIFSYVFPWVRAPETLPPTEHRYLISAALGITIFFAGIIGLGKEFRNRFHLFLLTLPFLIINITSTQAFLNDVVQNSHGSDAIIKMWSSFPYIPEMGKTEQPLLFYFDSSPDKYRLKHHSLSFGFPYKMAIIYNIHDEDIYDSIRRMPIAVNDWKDVVSAITDGEYLNSIGYAGKTIPINNIYAFFLTSDNNLINKTEETRNKLKELKQNLK